MPPGSALVLGAPLPTGPDNARLLAALEKSVLPGLARAQKAHISRFSMRGLALGARISRLLARALALEFAPWGSMLDMDGCGKPVFTGKTGISLAFSHSASAAFCMLWREPDLSRTRPIAIDAECFAMGIQSGALSAHLRKISPCLGKKREPGPKEALRAWTIYEALLKTGNASSKCAKINFNGMRKGWAIAHGKPAYWKSRAFMGHWLTVAIAEIPPASLEIRWIRGGAIHAGMGGWGRPKT